MEINEFSDIKKMRKNKGLTQSELAKAIGVDIKTVQNWEAGRPIPKTKYGILRAIFSQSSTLAPSVVESSSMVSVETRPYIPFPVAAGELSGVGADGVMAAQMEQMAVVPFLPPYDVTTQVVGDSMRPRFLSGDIIALRDITKAGDFFQNGKVHVLDTAQGYVLKAVTLDKAHSRFICHSLNPDFPDFEVSTEDVYHVFLVVGLVRRC